MSMPKELNQIRDMFDFIKYYETRSTQKLNGLSFITLSLSFIIFGWNVIDGKVDSVLLCYTLFTFLMLSIVIFLMTLLQYYLEEMIENFFEVASGTALYDELEKFETEHGEQISQTFENTDKISFIDEIVNLFSTLMLSSAIVGGLYGIPFSLYF